MVQALGAFSTTRLAKMAGTPARSLAVTWSGHDARTLAAEFALSREARPGIKKPVLHVSLALPPGEDVTSDKWAEIAADFSEMMGLEGHQMVAIRHHDTDIGHVHLVYSRIGLDGSVWHGKFDVHRAIEATQILEEKHGLTRTKGLDDGPAPVSRPTKGEIEMQDRTGEPAPRLGAAGHYRCGARGRAALDLRLHRAGRGGGCHGAAECREDGQDERFQF